MSIKTWAALGTVTLCFSVSVCSAGPADCPTAAAEAGKPLDKPSPSGTSKPRPPAPSTETAAPAAASTAPAGHPTSVEDSIILLQGSSLPVDTAFPNLMGKPKAEEASAPAWNRLALTAASVKAILAAGH